MTQVIAGVNITVALTASFQSAFASSVAFILNIDATAVNIGSVVAVAATTAVSRRHHLQRLLAGAGGGVSVLYTVTANNVAAATLKVALNNAISTGG